MRKFTTKRPFSLMRMLVGYNDPMKKKIFKSNFFFRKHTLSDIGTYPGALPVVGCQYRPSKEWQCRIQKLDGALNGGQNAAIHRSPGVSGTHKTRKEAHAGSRKIGPGSTPAKNFHM